MRVVSLCVFLRSWQPIVDYIESKYEEYLNAESRVQRQPIRDNRVHVCLYFIQPSGHGLKPLDVEFMKRLHDKVNIIPILAKADTMTPDECTYFKKQVDVTYSTYGAVYLIPGGLNDPPVGIPPPPQKYPRLERLDDSTVSLTPTFILKTRLGSQ